MDSARSASPETPQRSALDRALAQPWFLAAWCTLAAFGTYACMYGFRKPFTAGAFSALYGGAALKVWLISAQVLGYTLSKLVGIRLIAEMTRARRLRVLLALIAGAELAWLLLALAPAEIGPLFLFQNGLCLGLVFGLVLGFVEGRRMTELFVAGLCASFILADGFTKSVGAWLLQIGIEEAWMPVSAGALFAPPLLLGAWMLSRIPAPTMRDVAERHERVPLSRPERWSLLRRHGLGLCGIFAAYLAITILRSVRADYAPELWRALGVAAPPSIFTRSEFLIALAVLGVSASLVLIRDHRRALAAALGLSATALALGLGAAAALAARPGGSFEWMVLLGFGLYTPYVLVHTSIFERWIALTRERANVGFLMYVADTLGYAGYAAMMIASGWLRSSDDFLGFFVALAASMLGAALLGVLLSTQLVVRSGSALAALSPR
ncbi:MAG: hypothetical protein JNM84_23410 [Planctomycetes bacterium]|nr:hypothetical protein [Planctomycetota bacterium]